MPLHVEHKYMPEDTQKCPNLTKLAGPAARDIMKAPWKPGWEPRPEDGGVTEETIKKFDKARAAAGHINLAKGSRVRPDSHKSILNGQSGHPCKTGQPQHSYSNQRWGNTETSIWCSNIMLLCP